MSNDGMAINQHYVPQFLLRNFSFGKKDYLWCFDKKTGRKFQTGVRNVAAERGFYNFDGDAGAGSLEPYMGRIEDLSAPLIKRIVRERSIKDVSDQERRVLSAFFAAQFLRTNAQREMIEDSISQFKRRLLAMGVADEDLVRGGMGEPEKLAKKISLQNLLEINEYAPYFYGRDWHLSVAPKTGGVYIGDNPVVLHNSTPADGPWGNLGLALSGVELYISLSDELILSMWCPSILERFRLAQAKSLSLTELEKVRHKEKIALNSKRLEDLTVAKLVRLEEENVTHHNYLQVMYAERYIYSSKDNFDLVERIINSHPRARQGMRTKVS
ncbi:DUF4238 domain-containing protein [Ectopseudomonas khazarica]|uniref:DUF4238 domain-containing protein n=1 Tax=Ectopseudomonas khazarica TaxID=2502979 RepID=UPI003B9408C7